MKSVCDIATNNINPTHRFVSKMYVPLSKSTISISNCVVTNCTAGDFKGFIYHPSSNVLLFVYRLVDKWDFTGVTCRSEQTGCSALFPQGPTNYMLSQEVSSLRTGFVIWFMAPIPPTRSPVQDPVTNISSAMWSSQHLCATHYLIFSLRYDIKHTNSERQKWEQQPVLLTAQYPPVCVRRSEPAVLLCSH